MRIPPDNVAESYDRKIVRSNLQCYVLNRPRCRSICAAQEVQYEPRMRKQTFGAVTLVLGLLFFAPLWSDSAFAADRRVALVIGNSAYVNAPTLPNPAKDAKSVAAMFQKAGYDVVSTAYNVGNLDFKRAIRQFEDAAADSDIAVVYYAGHGIEIHGSNYVIPVDAKLASDRDADDEAITLDRLVESVDGAKRLRVIILDACRDNPFARTMKQQRTAALRGVNPGLTAAEPSSINTLIAYAAKAGSEAEDGDGDHSPFATALVNNLFVPGLDIRLAFGRVRDEVLKKTGNRQEPFVYGSLGGGNVALVPGQDQPVTANATGEKGDYDLVEKIGTKGAWQVFLNQHPSGFYSDLARQQIEKLTVADASPLASSAGQSQPTLVAVSTSATPVESKPQPAPAGTNNAPQTNIAILETPKEPAQPVPTTEEQRGWEKIKDSNNASDFRAFIKKYPSSVLANIALAHAEAIENAAKEQAAKAKAEREAAAAQAAAEETKRQAQLAEAKRQADEAARLKAEQAKALLAAQEAAKAAAQAQKEAEREAALKRDEEAHQAALASAARAKQQADADAAKQADQQAALLAAQEAAKVAEQARLDAQRAAQAQQDDACRSEQDRLTSLQTEGARGRDDLLLLQQGLTCERLRPLVTAALSNANALPDVNTHDQVRSTQEQLARLGCYSGPVNGNLSPATTAAVQQYESERGKSVGVVDITDALVADLKTQSARVCPLVCPTGKVADGERCIAVAKPVPVAHKDDDEQHSTPRKSDESPSSHHEAKHEDRSQAKPHVVQQATSNSGGGAHIGASIGVGF